MAGLTVLRSPQTSQAAVQCTTDQISALRGARSQTDKLFCLVHDEYLYDRPVPELQRLIFFLGCMDTYEWTLIGREELDRPAVCPELEQLFGRSPIAGDDGFLDDSAHQWPSVDHVRRYVAGIRRELDAFAHHASARTVQEALEQRMMFAELVSSILHNMPYRQKKPVPIAQCYPCINLPQRQVWIPAGIAHVGVRREDVVFCSEAEVGTQALYVPAFTIDRRKVSNGDYLAFVREGAAPPHYWQLQAGRWMWRSMFGPVPLPLDAPVYVTHAEAAAYAAWRGKALPTEAQYHRAAYGSPGESPRRYPWGKAEPTRAHGNFDFHHWDPIACDVTPAGESAFGVAQLCGNGWEWTSTPYEPEERRRRRASVQSDERQRGASTRQAVADVPSSNHHYILKGASPRTAACLLRPSYRNISHPEAKHVYAGFRCVGP